ncbi:hypothetical protein [Falsirhodobacter halotolerans]|uniref:hypothetical protein n=1 Tax=Falsirhodobacter halotolerans TaxID=1146892 RepID=UPI001FD22F49|nr:hypothetical protein [Falsirhodobacter halotolerans]MCJ8139341.1 hypothetical protein [Falsirhodobacter halotolerans]
MADTFTIKQGDTSPALARVVETAAGLIDLGLGDRVTFSMRRPYGGPVVVNRQPCQIREDNVVVYFWHDDDTAVPGLHEAEFEIIRADGAIETVPNGGYLVVNVVGAVA